MRTVFGIGRSNRNKSLVRRILELGIWKGKNVFENLGILMLGIGIRRCKVKEKASKVK